MQIALQIAAGISSVLGLAAFVAVLVLWQQASGRRHSVEDGLIREGIASPGSAVAILKTFKDDAPRLEAVRTLMNGDVAKAELVLKKFKANEGIGAAFKNMRALEHRRNVLSVLFGVFIVCAAIFYALAQQAHATPSDRRASCTVPRDDYHGDMPGRFAIASWCPPGKSGACHQEYADHAVVDGQCEDGAPYGHWTARYPSGTVKWEGDVFDNHPIGVWYSNGDRSHVQRVYDDNGMLMGGGGMGEGPLPPDLDFGGSDLLDIKSAACACTDAVCAANVQQTLDTWTRSHVAAAHSGSVDVTSKLTEDIKSCLAKVPAGSR